MRARGVDEMAVVVAALAAAAGTALDPTSILQRTMAVLDPVVDLGLVTLWEEVGGAQTLVASHPAAPSDEPAPRFEEQSTAADAVVVPLDRRGQPAGRLVVRRRSGTPFGPNDRALIGIAGTQVAGALERAELFNEVMELERLKSDFIARVSHELRTPITIINGFLETLLAHGGDIDPDGRVHMLERSRAAAARLDHLIEELLVLSRLEGGVVSPQRELVALADTLAAVRSTSARPDHVVVHGGSATVRTDGTLLVRALGCVVDNALKYGGSADVSARPREGGWAIEVADQGPGFAEDVRATAFELFTRSQSVATVPGLGAGLAIARTIVEVLDGTITLDDRPDGPGAVVRITLPG